MTARFLKVSFFSMLALLAWMVVSALFTSQDDAYRSIAESTTDVQPAERKKTVDSLASKPVVLKASPEVAKADRGKTAKLEVKAPTSSSFNTDLSVHSMHQKTVPQNATPPRKHVDPKTPVARDGYGTPILDWDLLGSTTVDDELKPTFLKKLSDVRDMKVTLTGFMQPLDEVGEMGSFLLMEYPLGCFYCLTPTPTGLVHIELAEGKRHELVRELVKITGKLHLNSDSPEDFIYSIREAEITLAE